MTLSPRAEPGRTITALVNAAAQRFAEAPALRDSTGRTMLHAELHERAKATEGFLAGLGLDRGRPIGLLVDHRIESVVAMLGIVGAGHFYLPFDPRWPQARIEALASRLGMECLFADEKTSRSAADMTWRVPSLRHLIRLDLESADWPDELEPDTVAALWDEVAESEDWAEAAGFGTFELSGAGHEKAAAYYRHVEQLAVPLCGPGSRVLEIGCGTGEVAALIAPRVAEYVGVDPSGAAIRRLTERCAVARGVTGFADRVPEVGGNFDLAIFSSTVQFFPSTDYFVTALSEAARLLTAGGRILISDLVDPGSEEHGGLRLPPEFFTEVVASFTGVCSCAVAPRPRPDGLPGRGRFDVLLTLAAGNAVGRGNTLAAGERVHRWTGWHVARSTARSGPEVSGEDLAYTIFTSGSTGTPKGVAVAHAEAVRVIEWMNAAFGVRHGDTLLFVTAFSFDLSVYDVFGPLAAGACVRILSDRELGEPESIIQVLAGEPVTIWDSAPAAMQRILPLVTDAAGSRSSLRLVLLSGDWIPVPMPDRIRELFPRADVVSLGGATECTIWSNYYLIQKVDPGWPSIPYGRAMPHARYAVLDDRLRPCPAGVPGDLYIGGDCLAVGYFGAPARTAERFIADPMAAGRRMYATGDRALWLDDGNLRFLGRLDDQVKVHGYRIELGEIQSNLVACPHVQECAVIAPGRGADRKLVGFYVPAGAESTGKEVAAWLGGILPPYMVPGDLIPVTQLPVSVNGKLDRAALARQYAEIRDSAIRAGLARAWSRAIGREPRTIDEDFFEAGADSVTAAQLTLLILEETEVLLDVADVFAAPTVRGLARKVGCTRLVPSEPSLGLRAV